ncbi:hypothetical protein [Hahella ganghwensis]|uniref:hypothetical protein n=1 Tax=Hahella ganghwensis TaxID=286420 RepID=UPI0003650CB3|nr:hypothetical protein [Hahella ganghwensis]
MQVVAKRPVIQDTDTNSIFRDPRAARSGQGKYLPERRKSSFNDSEFWYLRKRILIGSAG